MEKKISTVMVFLLLIMAFWAVSVLVIITKRNSWLVRKKLRIGALLLSLGGVAAGCGVPPVSSCYVMPAPVNEFVIDDADNESKEIVVSRSGSGEIYGRVWGGC